MTDQQHDHGPGAPRPGRRPFRSTARAVGVIYVAGMVLGIMGNLMILSVLGAADPMTSIAANSTLLAVGAVLWLLTVVGDAAHGVLMYPVITMKAATHGGSRKNLLGDTPTDAQLTRFSADERVTAATPPLFIVHAADDKTVPVQNSVMMAAAAAKAGVPCELHLLHAGGHGFGLGRSEETERWFGQCVAWLRGMKMIDDASPK